MHAKAKGFGIRQKGACKSGRDGQPTSIIFKYYAEGERDQKYINNPNRKRKAKELTRCDCLAEIRFKWIKEADHWIVTRFVAEHTYTLAKQQHARYFRLVNM